MYHDFYLGDVVKVVSGESEFLGRTGAVTKIYEFNTRQNCYVDFGGNVESFWAEELELINRVQF